MQLHVPTAAQNSVRNSGETGTPSRAHIASWIAICDVADAQQCHWQRLMDHVGVRSALAKFVCD